MAQKIARYCLNDVFNQLWPIGFEALPLFCDPDTFIIDGIIAELILTNSRFYIGKPSARGKNDKKHATKTMKLDAMGFL
ncbi:hypothetical protein SDC9_138761 [bioreactor metagenome]|uniref:Uncharacterized protein n=1 Tax=bioreactor metagenome TaxID=1076179 RepID=A0A645DQ70_9ZZZZ